MFIIYALLITIIILLIKIIYSNRDKGAHFNKLFSSDHFKDVKEYKKDDGLSKSHPAEYVKFMGRYMARREADRLAKLFGAEKESSD